MKANYRVIFSGHNKSKHFDIYAKSSDQALSDGYKLFPDARYRGYENILVEEIPTEPSPIGIEFKYTDTFLKRDFTGYLIIKAKDETQAKDYYNKHFKGKRFWFNAGEIEDNGKCVYGNIKSTYFAACIGYDADATL